MLVALSNAWIGAISALGGAMIGTISSLAAAIYAGRAARAEAQASRDHDLRMAQETHEHERHLAYEARHYDNRSSAYAESLASLVRYAHVLRHLAARLAGEDPGSDLPALPDTPDELFT